MRQRRAFTLAPPTCSRERSLYSSMTRAATVPRLPSPGSFSGPAQVPSTRAGSLGFGNNQGIGIFVDHGATSIADTYLVDNEPGCVRSKFELRRRGNGIVLPPGFGDCTSDGGGAGLFIDQ